MRLAETLAVQCIASAFVCFTLSQILHGLGYHDAEGGFSNVGLFLSMTGYYLHRTEML